jgi:hypothetical protein
MTTRQKWLSSNRLKHPIGNGVPGPQNWSGTDNATIELAPLGGIPELVRWSVSMVLTPGGWVGRIDNHLTHKTEHLEVSPNIPPAIAEIRAIVQKKYVELQAKREKEDAERLEAVSALAETIRARVEELDQNILDDLGISREDLEEMALEQAGILDYGLLEREEDLDDLQNNGSENYDAYLFDNMDDFSTKGTRGYTFPSQDEKKAQRRLGRGSY